MEIIATAYGLMIVGNFIIGGITIAFGG